MSLPDLAIVGGDVVTTHVGPATVVVHAGRIERLQAPAQPAPGREDAFEGPATTGLAHVLQVLEMLRDLGLRCVFHAEDESLIDLYTARVLQHDGPDHLRDASSPPVVGATAAAGIVQLALATDCPTHIAHVSSAAPLDVIGAAKRVGAPVTTETCAHDLFCTEDDLAQAGPFGVINPPFRQASDRDALSALPWAPGRRDAAAAAVDDRRRREPRTATCATPAVRWPDGCPPRSSMAHSPSTTAPSSALPVSVASSGQARRPSPLQHLANLLAPCSRRPARMIEHASPTVLHDRFAAVRPAARPAAASAATPAATPAARPVTGELR